MRRYGALPVKPYLRVSRAPSGSAGLKGHIIGWMGSSALEKIAACAYIASARGLFGIYNFEGSTLDYAARMTRWLAQAPTGSILMCHPAQAAEPGDDIGVARAQEFAYLVGPEFTAALQTAKVKPVRGRVALQPSAK